MLRPLYRQRSKLPTMPKQSHHCPRQISTKNFILKARIMACTARIALTRRTPKELTIKLIFNNKEKNYLFKRKEDLM